MVQILEGNSFGSKLGAALGGGLGKGFAEGMSKSQDFAQKMQLQEMKQKKDQNFSKEQTLDSLRGTVNQLKAMAEEDVSGIGRFGQFSQSPAALENRGRFQTLTSDLFTFYKSLFPRGITQEEFKRLERDYIPRSGEPTSAMIGKLDGFLDLIDRKLGEIENQKKGSDKEDKGNIKKIKFDKNNSEHKAKATQLFKKFGDREKVREKLKLEFEGL